MTKKNSLDIACLPKHVAIIMDGNGRWANKRGLSRLEGHRAGVDNVRRVVKSASKYGVEYLTLFGFSTENWSRPLAEVNGLLALLEERIDAEALELHKNNIRILHLGRLDELQETIRAAINRAAELTRNNSGMTLGFAFNYGGRREILDAARRILASGVSPDSVDEQLFAGNLYTTGMPDVDLVIRTSGELRVSNFMLWQAAYSEYYFTEVLWPDFDEEELGKALLSYSQRKRRFGGL